jgi:hypothetical protein
MRVAHPCALQRDTVAATAISLRALLAGKPMRRLLWVAAVALVVSPVVKADEWVVEAHYPNQATLHRATALFQHVTIDAKRQVLRVDTDEQGVERLQDVGLAVSVDLAGTAKLRGFQEAMRSALQSGAPQRTTAGYPSIPGYACYRTVEGAYQTMDDLVGAYPDLVEIHEIGPSWKKAQGSGGYEMRALRITDLATAAAHPERPKFVAFGSIHAREYTPAELLTRLAEWLVTEYGRDPQATWLVDNVDFRLILMANPDGRKRAETGLSWRKNINDVQGYCNSSTSVGIDLNRNFPFHWNTTGGQGSSGSPCDETFRGTSAGSEPETQNLVGYVAGTLGVGGYSGGALPDRRNGSLSGPAPEDYSGLFFDIHSYSQLVLWSWGDTTTPAPNDASLRTLGRRLAWFNGYTPQAAVELYPTDGTTDDTFYGLIGAPSYTIELGTSFFESCANFASDTFPKNFDALRYAARATQASYQLPWGPDTVTVNALQDLVVTGEPIELTARLDSARFNNANGSQSSSAIASAAALFDAPPWMAGATGMPLLADDGAFNSTLEDVHASLPSAGLSSGRHLVFVQGTDAMGRAGTPDANFIEIVEPEAVASLSGHVVRDADDAPLVATVIAREMPSGIERRTQSVASNGSYTRRVIAGSLDIRVSAPGYLDEEAHGVVLAGGQSVVKNFRMLPVCTLLTDDVEQNNATWTAQSPWAIVSNVPNNATRVWNTPSYGSNLSRSLTLASPVDLSGYAQLALEFDDRCATEANYDFGRVEYSTTHGLSWNDLYSCSGRTTWQSNRLELPANVGGSGTLLLRFRLQSDPSVSGAGWAVDNIRLTAGGQACRDQQVPLGDAIFADGFEWGVPET